MKGWPSVIAGLLIGSTWLGAGAALSQSVSLPSLVTEQIEINTRLRIGDVNSLHEVFPKTIRVGVRSDASPFSYKAVSRMSEQVIAGYGGYMVEICRRVLTQMTMSGPFNGFQVVAYDVTAGNRFELLNQGKLDMLCGPDSITLSRLRQYNASHPVFLSGLTYVSVENDNIPRTQYCRGVIGLVRRTTAESTGLQIISRNRELARFHAPLESYMAIMSDPGAYATSQKDNEIDDQAGEVSVDDIFASFLSPIMLKDSSPTDNRSSSLQPLQVVPERVSDSASKQVRELTAGDTGSSLVQHPGDWIKPESVMTGECPNGYENGPVVFFSSHAQGLKALCDREILFYMGDFDIIRERLNGMSNCKTVMRRETITNEAYGAYFRKFRGERKNHAGGSPVASYLDSLLYAEFNNVLLQKMQTAEGILDYEFHREFGDEGKTQDLQQFFDSFKFASHY